MTAPSLREILSRIEENPGNQNVKDELRELKGIVNTHEKQQGQTLPRIFGFDK